MDDGPMFENTRLFDKNDRIRVVYINYILIKSTNSKALLCPTILYKSHL